MTVLTVIRDVLLVLAGGAASIAATLCLTRMDRRKKRDALGRLVVADMIAQLRRVASYTPDGAEFGINLTGELRKVMADLGMLAPVPSRALLFAPTAFNVVSANFDALHPKAVLSVFEFYHELSVVAERCTDSLPQHDFARLEVRAYHAAGCVLEHMMGNSKLARRFHEMHQASSERLEKLEESIRDLDKRIRDGEFKTDEERAT